MPEDLPYSAACERNKGPILDVLRGAFAAVDACLEIGSGSGQHAVHFARALQHLVWQPSETAAQLPGLAARVAQEGPPNLRPPLELDVEQPAWPLASTPAVFSANTLHIVSWPQVQALFAGIGRVLAPRGVLAIYGPFRCRGAFTTDSNAQFDAMLRGRDPRSGIRDAEAVDALAAAQGLVLIADHALPANNQLRVWQRGS